MFHRGAGPWRFSYSVGDRQYRLSFTKRDLPGATAKQSTLESGGTNYDRRNICAHRPGSIRRLDLAQLADNAMVLGHVGPEAVLLVRRGEEIFAIGNSCSHYHGPLNEGLVVGDTVRCPWHHACFSLRTGEKLRAPALDPVPAGGSSGRATVVFVREKQRAGSCRGAAPAAAPRARS